MEAVGPYIFREGLAGTRASFEGLCRSLDAEAEGCSCFEDTNGYGQMVQLHDF